MLKIQNKRGMALSQIILLLVGTLAIAYAIGSEIGVVSGKDYWTIVDKKIVTIEDIPSGNPELMKQQASTMARSMGGSVPFDEYSKAADFLKRGNGVKTAVTVKPVGQTTASTSNLVSEPAAGTGKATPLYESVFDFGEDVNPKTTNWQLENEGNMLSKGNFLDGLVSGVAWGASAYFAVQTFAPIFGYDDAYQIKIASEALGIGVTFGRWTSNAIQNSKWRGSTEATNPGGIGFGVAIAVAYMYYRINYKETSFKVSTFNSRLWQAPIGGANCELCNSQEFPCSEYQCRSLGLSCELLNDEDSGEQFCADVNKNDVIPPEISTWSEPLLAGYRYTPDSASAPPDRGVIIENTNATDKCIKAFTPLAFGITVDEPAVCKADYNRTSFEEMQFFFGENSNYAYNHTQILSLPGKANADAENLTLYNNGNFGIYIKCMDRKGNQNKNDFVFKFCVEKGPDTEAPYVIATNIINGMPVAFGQSSVNFEVYLNEPAECRWSHDDKSYDNMVEQMKCVKNIRDSIQRNAQMAYNCSTNLTGIQDKKENKFYFRCRDQPMLSADRQGDRNENSQSLPTSAGFTIIGTQPLVIDKVGPANETIKDSAVAVKVTLTAETSAGYKEGLAMCSYAEEGNDQYIEFFNTSSYTHSTDLYLPEGEYTYNIRCVDLGGNSDTETVIFETESDSEAPVIVRAYREENSLKIVTNEDSECVYDTKSCTYLFNDGLPTTTSTTDESAHYIDWSTKTKLYIKCRDGYGNEPAPDTCSAIIRPIEN